MLVSKSCPDTRNPLGSSTFIVASTVVPEANDRYYASEQRPSLRPEPSELIEEARQVMVDPVL